jgi:hypothetical protein
MNGFAGKASAARPKHSKISAAAKPANIFLTPEVPSLAVGPALTEFALNVTNSMFFSPMSFWATRGKGAVSRTRAMRSSVLHRKEVKLQI